LLVLRAGDLRLPLAGDRLRLPRTGDLDRDGERRRLAPVRRRGGDLEGRRRLRRGGDLELDEREEDADLDK